MTKYIIAIMGALIAYLGICYVVDNRKIDKLASQIKTTEGERDRAVEAAQASFKNLESYISSCEQTLATISAKAERDRVLNKTALGTLEKVNKTKPSKVEVKREQSVPTSVFELDPDYVRLLNNAYCHENTDDPYCTSR